MKHYLCSSYIFAILLYFPFVGSSVGLDDVVWKGCIKSKQDNAVVGFATIASYKKVSMFSASEEGCFNLVLPADDSIRIAVMGFEPRTLSLKDLTEDSNGSVIIYLKPMSYQIQEVTVRANGGRVQLSLPDGIGSGVSELPPNERPDPGGSSPLSPVSFMYNLLSRRGDPNVDLAKARAKEKNLQHRDIVAGREVIATLSGLEGKKLDRFIIHCNIHLNVGRTDDPASVNRRILNLLEDFLEKEKNR